MIRERSRAFCLSDVAASTSEYAAIFAVVVIAFMVSANILGRKVSRTVSGVDSRLVVNVGGPGQGPGAPPASASTEKDADESLKERLKDSDDTRLVTPPRKDQPEPKEKERAEPKEKVAAQDLKLLRKMGKQPSQADGTSRQGPPPPRGSKKPGGTTAGS
jgi:hypothetical protein